MLPGGLELVVLALAAFRLTRLIGWDDLPPVARARARLLGETPPAYEVSQPVWSPELEQFVVMGTPPDDEAEPEYRRELLAEMFHCPFCLGFWVSLGTYLAWAAWPGAVFWAAVPLALSGAVGLAAKNLDP